MCFFGPEDISSEPGSAFYDAAERAGSVNEAARRRHFTGWWDLD